MEIKFSEQARKKLRYKLPLWLLIPFVMKFFELVEETKSKVSINNRGDNDNKGDLNYEIC